MKEIYEKAIEYYLQSIEVDKSKAECHYNLGNAYVILQDYNKAIESFEKTCELDTKHVAAFYNLGNAYLLIKDTKNAIKAFKEVSTLESSSYDWKYRIALALDDYGETDEALAMAEEALKLKDDFSELLFLKGKGIIMKSYLNYFKL